MSDENRNDLTRRELMAMAGAFGSAFVAAQGLTAEAGYGDTRPLPAANAPAGGKRYDMKKSINLWALPYPAKMTLRECFAICKDAGFDAVEVNYALDGDLRPEATDADVAKIGRMAREMGLEISGVCSFLFWPYALSHADAARRQKGLELALDMIRVARLLETENLLVVPGAVYIPWLEDEPAVPFDVCDRRAKEAVRAMLVEAQKSGVSINIENIFVNGYLHSPEEMIAFVDSFDSPQIGVHFDTGNIMMYHFPEHWIPLLGKRIRNVHLKEFNKKVHEFNLNTFRPLLDGTTNWPAVMEAFEQIGYRGYLTFEYFNPFPHWPEVLVYQTSDAMDRMLGRKA